MNLILHPALVSTTKYHPDILGGCTYSPVLCYLSNPPTEQSSQWKLLVNVAASRYTNQAKYREHTLLSSFQFTCPSSRPVAIYICHCTQCRRQSGSAFGISAIFPAFAIDTVNANHLQTWSRPTQSGKTMKCYFCGICGSRLMHARDGVKSVSIKGGALDLTNEMLKDAIHIWAKKAVIEIPGGAQVFDGEPPDD